MLLLLQILDISIPRKREMEPKRLLILGFYQEPELKQLHSSALISLTLDIFYDQDRDRRDSQREVAKT